MNPGAYYHVMARGNRREAIFMDDDDPGFLHALSEAREKTGWRVSAWVLMGNHYHLLIQTPEENLSAGMTAMPREWLVKECAANPQSLVRARQLAAEHDHAALQCSAPDMGGGYTITAETQ